MQFHNYVHPCEHPAFTQAVLYAFGYMEDYGYQCIQEEISRVRYVSKDVFISILHEHPSCEIYLDFNLLKDEHEEGYGVSYLIKLSDIDAAEKYRNHIALTPETIVEGVNRLSSIFKKYSKRLLSGDLTIFTDLRQLADQQIGKSRVQTLVNQIRPKAEEAFHKRQFAKVIELYSQIDESALTKAEKMKVEFARKHI